MTEKASKCETTVDDLWREFPKTATEFEERFQTEADCRAYLIQARLGRSAEMCQM